MAPRRLTPDTVWLEATSVCQLACPGCLTASGDIEKNFGRAQLSEASFRSFLEKNPFVRHVELSNNGEMFLNTELVAILRCAKEKGIRLTANNGVNFNSPGPTLLKALVEYGFFSLTISLDGASEETYGQYRRNGRFQRVIENIRTLNTLKKEAGAVFPLLVWQFVVFGHNEHEMETAKAMASELGMAIRFKLQWESRFSPVKDLEKVRSVLQAATREEYQAATGTNYMQGTCRQLWKSPVVHPDGKMLGCCKNSWEPFDGNVFTSDLPTVLAAPRITYAREMLQGKKPSRDDIPCSRCDVYQSMQTTQRFLAPEDVE